VEGFGTITRESHIQIDSALYERMHKTMHDLVATSEGGNSMNIAVPSIAITDDRAFIVLYLSTAAYLILKQFRSAGRKAERGGYTAMN